MITEPGIYAIPAETYHADRFLPEPSLSSTVARRIIETCPARAWWEKSNPQPPSDALIVGSAAHEWLLEGETWPQRHVVLPPDHDGRTKDGRALKASIVAAGKRPVAYDDFQAIRAMKEALEAHPFAGAAFRAGRAETTLIWRDEDHGIWCRARPDFLPRAGRIIADYKTTVSAEPAYLRRAVRNYGYDQQAAWYLAGLRALGFVDPQFLFVFQEKTAPYLITPVTLSARALNLGAELNRQAAVAFAHGLRTGEWPGYADDIIEITTPAWAENALEAA